jgi:hypothetical protein
MPNTIQTSKKLKGKRQKGLLKLLPGFFFLKGEKKNASTVSVTCPAETLSAPSTNSAFLPPASSWKINQVFFLTAIIKDLPYILICKVSTDDTLNI